MHAKHLNTSSVNSLSQYSTTQKNQQTLDEDKNIYTKMKKSGEKDIFPSKSNSVH